MESPFLPYGRQHIDEGDIASVIAVLRGDLITQGPCVERFEAALGNYLGADHVTVCSTGTAALHLVYAGLGLGPGDEIITSPITFSATASAARQLGVTVRFADVEPDTGNICASSVRELITPRTRAIVAVHLGGLPADLTALRAIADAHGLYLIEDAAHALGALYDGKMIGSGPTTATTFSFHPVKHVTTGEGGAVVTGDPALKRRIDALRHHGIERTESAFERPSPGPWYYEVQQLGFNYRLSDIQCALGASQLAKQPGWVARRCELAARYGRLIAARFDYRVVPQADRIGRRSAHHLYPVLIDFPGWRTSRAHVMRALRRAGIGTNVHYIPLTQHPCYRVQDEDTVARPGAASYYARTLSLPMFPTLSNDDVDRVITTLSSVLREACK